MTSHATPLLRDQANAYKIRQDGKNLWSEFKNRSMPSTEALPLTVVVAANALLVEANKAPQPSKTETSSSTSSFLQLISLPFCYATMIDAA